MNVTKTKALLPLALAGISLCWEATPASAQNKVPPQRQTTITDAAGRVHVRSARVTYAQRKAAAERRVKDLRRAAARKAAMKKMGEVKK
jgi:hypothetical protein